MISLARAALTLLAGGAGGAVFYALGIPLPWMLGSLTVAALLAVLDAGWRLPAALRTFAAPVVGVLAGSAFTPAIIRSMAEWWTVIPFLVIFLVGTTLAGTLFFSRLCKYDAVTAFFASTPAGLAELTPVASQLGADVRTLVVIHSLRIVCMACVVPFVVVIFSEKAMVAASASLPSAAMSGTPIVGWMVLVGCAVGGYVIGRSLPAIAGTTIVPLVLSAIAHATGLTEMAPPSWTVACVQVVVGAVSGARFAGLRWKEARVTIVQGIVWASFLLLAAGGMAAVAALAVDMPVIALMLAFSPGGMAELTIVTYAFGIEVAFVVMCHVFRAVAVVGLAPVIFQLVQRRGRTRPPPV